MHGGGRGLQVALDGGGDGGGSAPSGDDGGAAGATVEEVQQHARGLDLAARLAQAYAGTEHTPPALGPEVGAIYQPAQMRLESGSVTDRSRVTDVVFPGASEVCDEQDNDCDGDTDDLDADLDPTTASTWYLDYEGDG